LLKIKLLNYLSKGILNRNSDFLDRHKGESCYIFGNGTSLKYFDLNRFSDRISISCNNLFLHKDFNKLDVRYYFSGHPFFYYKYWKNPYNKRYVNNTLGKLFKEQIIKNNDVNYFINLSNYFGLRKRNVYYLYHFDKMFSDYKDCNICSEFPAMSGSLQAMLGLAINLGFEKITLVGCDYTFSPKLGLHFFEYGKGISLPSQKPFAENFLKSAIKYADIDTLLLDDNYQGHFLNGITYNKKFNVNPSFKENDKIVAADFLYQLENCKMNYKILSY
jgi:hypothetical protein